MNRIVCQKCRANNFPGQPRCFQCGASLPPPEAVQPAGYSQPHFAPQPQSVAQAPQIPNHGAFPTPPYPSYARRNSSLPLVAGVIAIVVVCCGMLFLFTARKVSARRGATGMAASAQVEELDRLRRDHGISTPDTPAHDADTEATRQELSRLRDKFGINTGNPHNPNDGSVPNGGNITFDQWRRSHSDSTNYQFR